MNDICNATCIVSVVIVVAVLSAMAWYEEKKGRKDVLGVALAVIILVLAGGVLGYIQLQSTDGLLWGSWSFRNSGTAPALYFEPHVIGVDNGSAVIIWESNSGKVYDHNPSGETHGQLKLAQLDNRGRRISPGPPVEHGLPFAWDGGIREVRYQDGFIFVKGDYGYEYGNIGGLRLQDFPSRVWQESTIYNLPSGPVLIPPKIKWPILDVYNNGLRNSTGMIYFLNGSFPVTCTVLDGNGNIAFNETPFLYWDQLYGLKRSVRLAFDDSDRLLMLWGYGNSVNELKIYNPNLTLAGEFGFDEYIQVIGPRFGLLNFASLGGSLCGFIATEWNNDGSTPHSDVNVTLVTMTLNATGVSDMRLRQIATINRTTAVNCGFGSNGESVLLVYEYKDELYLRSMDLFGNRNFKDIRLTPTDDTYSWDYFDD